MLSESGLALSQKNKANAKPCNRWSVLNTKYAVTFLEAVYTVTFQTWDFCELI